MSDDDTRVSQLKRWLAKPPPAAKRVLLIAASEGGQPVTLGDWDRDAMVPALASDRLDEDSLGAYEQRWRAALWDEITHAKGRVQQNNFGDYRVMRMNEAPTVEVHIVNSHDERQIRYR